MLPNRSEVYCNYRKIRSLIKEAEMTVVRPGVGGSLFSVALSLSLSLGGLKTLGPGFVFVFLRGDFCEIKKVDGWRVRLLVTMGAG